MARKTWDLLKVFLVTACLFAVLPGWCFNDEQEALMWEMHYADLGDATSQFKLGKIWEEGKKVPQCMDKALVYYHQAAKQNHIGANMALGRIYEKRDGMKQAFPYYLNAAERGYAPAQLIVSRYLDKEGRVEEALDWLTKALVQMFPEETDFVRVSPEYQTLSQKLGQSDSQ